MLFLMAVSHDPTKGAGFPIKPDASVVFPVILCVD